MTLTLFSTLLAAYAFGLTTTPTETLPEELPETISQSNQDTAQPSSESTLEQARSAQRRAVEFFHGQVAVQGGYVYQVSADLKLREGEGDAGIDSVWVQPPGTPSVGLAYLAAYRRTGAEYLLVAAKDAAGCLLRGQLHSGGWQNHIDFSPQLRGKMAYAVDGQPDRKARNISSLDDDQTQASLRFLIALDQTLQFKDAELHQAVLKALSAVIENQFPNGAWPQGFPVPELQQPSELRGNYPETWSRQFPGSPYWYFYTLNDQALVRMMQTMWLAGEAYDSDHYRQSALRAADFLLAAQMPEPQPAWAQQYNYQMQPAWARKFEPPALSGGESQVVMAALMDMAILTGERKYLTPLPRALEYLKSSALPDGRLARFYELKTNRPLYFTRQYELTYSDADLPTHYGFKVGNELSKLSERYEQLKELTADQLRALRASVSPPDITGRPAKAPGEQAVRQIIAAQDTRGAWVQPGTLKYIKAEPQQREMILSETFIKNLDQLSRFIAAEQ